MIMETFRNRIDAGRQLADALADYRGRTDLLVLGLPRGGVPVAFEIAQALGADLDVLIVRKLGYPGQEELAMGAIASGGIRVLNEAMGVSEAIIEEVTKRELEELHRRERAYRGERPFPKLEGRTVILVDDGLATGATMRAAVAAVRQRNPEEIVVAVPVAPEGTVSQLREEADDVVCLLTPEMFFGIGQFYDDFSQTTDDVVEGLLERAWTRPALKPEHRGETTNRA
jgi:putative phosphoribosyl transferase